MIQALLGPLLGPLLGHESSSPPSRRRTRPSRPSHPSRLHHRGLTYRSDDELDTIEKANKTSGRGAFYVSGGVELIPRIGELMDEAGRVWMSIDAHPADHVSFHGDENNPKKQSTMHFPPHCVDGTVGQCLVRQLYEKGIDKGLNNTTFFWKACDSEMDSFGAFPYPEDPADQKVFCTGNSPTGVNPARKICSEEKKENTTGGFVVANKLLKEGDKGIDNHKTLYHTPPKQRLEATSILEFTEGWIIGLEQKQERPEIYVCGLAGDWCVLDTCVNLKKMYKDRVDVVFLADFVQYSILPTQIFKDVDGEPNIIDHNLYPNRLDASEEVNNSFDRVPQRWLNDPNNTFHLLMENDVHVAIDSFKHGRTLFRQYKNRANRVVSKYSKLKEMTMDAVKKNIRKDNAILFVIDMQNDFAVPAMYLSPGSPFQPLNVEQKANYGKGLIEDNKLNQQNKKDQDTAERVINAFGWGRRKQQETNSKPQSSPLNKLDL